MVWWETSKEIYSLSLNVMAFEESLRVCVGEAVVVPQGARCPQELNLFLALVISKESWEGMVSQTRIQYQQQKAAIVPEQKVSNIKYPKL